MGNCLDGEQKQRLDEQQAAQQDAAPAAKPAMSQPASAASDPAPQMSKLSLAPVSASDTDTAPRPADGAADRPAPPLSDDAVASPMSSLQSSVRRQQPPANPNPQLTESALLELNSDGSARRGLPSSTGGTTANTRPTDAPDLPELSDVPEATEVDGPPATPGAVSLSTGGADMLTGTPPPVADHLPVVSLQDIAVMEQKQGRRRGRVRSRRGSTTASHASLSAIPENVEITPLHARSERSDSMRVTLSAHPVTRLADVQELDVESKSNTAAGSRPSGTESPRSTSSLLTSGDDSVMPHAVEAHVEQQLEMLMPLLATPRPYWRHPNATEAYRGMHRSPSGKGSAPPGTSPLGAQAPRSVLTQHSTAAAFAMSSPARPSQGGGGGERVVTDASGLAVLRSTVRGDVSRVLEADQLDLSAAPVDATTDLAPNDVPRFQQGLVQQETLRFALPEAVEGLRCVKKYTVGELSWDQTVLIGDLPAGEHEFTFAEGTVPTGTLTRGRYCMKTVFMDAHGQYLWAGLNQFELVPAEGAPPAPAPAPAAVP